MSGYHDAATRFGEIELVALHYTFLLQCSLFFVVARKEALEFILCFLLGLISGISS